MRDRILRFARNDWFRAFLMALALLLVLHAFVFRFVTVRSTSMYATLRPGDLLLVQRWAVWTGIERDDVVVFRDPLKDRDLRWRRPLLVKRLAGMPGDTLELRAGRLYINGARAADPPGLTYSHIVRLRSDADVVSFFRRHDMPMELLMPGRTTQEMPSNPELATRLALDSTVIDVLPMRLTNGSRSHIFPFSPRYPWNGDDFGPVRVPRKGDIVRITVDNLPLYDRIISVYEGHRLSNSGDTLLIDGLPLDAYEMEQDYCFVLGDSRHFSADSRYWGFLPMDHIIGRGGPVLLSKGED